ncbi:hypothetical protein [Streptomyces sp. SAS_270]|uniref:hypothetical protein n=1 Tax=Streptomyces sp. SAS_270 TaxID=3412748 RepID=UPI00403C7633
MKHRGRHRRRRRGQALRATLAGTALALTAAATLISTSQASGSGAPGALAPVSQAGPLRLHENLVDARTLDTLTRRMGGNVGVSGVLTDTDHVMRNRAGCDTAETDALPVEPTATRAYCWDRADSTSPGWVPRAVTTSGDADDDGAWGENRVILAGWTHSARTAGTPARDRSLARIAVIDANDPDRLTYRWILLVAPTDGGKDFTAVRSRLSGMVWYQGKLIVTAEGGADRAGGLLVFDLHRILKADAADSAIGRVNGGYAAHGYQYVLPAIGSYTPAGGRCDPTTDQGTPCPGALSLDRSSAPDSLVASERIPQGSDRRTRLWRYPFGLGTDTARGGLLAGDTRGRVDASEAYETKATGVSGVLSHRAEGASGADWYVDRTSDHHDVLWRQSGSGAKAAECTADQSHACWGRGTRSLSYWEQTGELWSLSPDGVLYAAPLTSVEKSLE